MQRTLSIFNSKRLYNFIKIVAFLFLAFLMVAFLSSFLARKSNHKYYETAKEPIDVLFFGNSHVAYGIYPMDLWRDYGIASYNLGNNACGLPASYWTLKYALEKQNPKVVVVDCNTVSAGFISPEGTYNEYLQAALDGIPMSWTKWEASRDLTVNPSNSLYYFFNFAVYHSRWEEVKMREAAEEQLYLGRGGDIWNNIATPIPSEALSGQEEPLSTIPGMGDWEYLRKIVTLCQEKRVPLLLTYIPFPARYDSLMEAFTVHTIVDWAKEVYGTDCLVDYLDYDTLLDGTGIHFSTDCSDADSHLNSSGVHKTDRFLGAFLQEHYQVPDRRGDKRYENWDEDLAVWTSRIADRVLSTTDWNIATMLLYDSGLDFYLEIPENSPVKDAKLTKKLIKQLKDQKLSREAFEQRYTGDHLEEPENIRIYLFEKEQQSLLGIFEK